MLSVYAERCKFYEAKQVDNETVMEWITRAKNLAMFCEFGEHLDHTLKDKFISGLKKGTILEKMFEMEANSTLKECIEAAQLREMTTRQKSAIITSINKLSHQSPRPSHNSNSDPILCYACNKPNHVFRICKYRTFTCSV